MPLAPPGDAAQTLEARLSRLSHAQLLRLVALGCNESTQVMAEASRMLVPLWAADRAAEEVFLSTDLLDCIMASLGAQDAAVASVCKVWAASWATLVARRRYVDTKPLRLQMSEPMFAMTTMPDGTLCFNLNPWDDTHTRSLRFMSSHSHPAQAVPPRLAQRVFGRVRSVRAAGDSVWVLCEDRRDHQIDCILRLRVSDGEEMASGFVGPDICEMKVADGLVFLAQDVERAQRWVLTARDANTLRPTHIFGSFDSPGLSAVPSCFAAADGKVFVVDGDRDVHVFEVPPAVPEKILLVGNSAARVFSLPARPNADFRCIADAAAQNGRLYVAEAFLKEVETDYEHVYGVVPDHDTVCIVDLACGGVLQEFQLTPSPHRVVDLNIDGNALQVLRIAHSDTEPTSELLTFKIHGEPPTLWAAVEAGDSSAVRQLLAAGADPTRGLPAAVNRGDTELVCTLLAAGADAQLVLPALGLADGRLAKLLLAIGADGAPVRPVAMEAWLQGGEEAVVRSLLAARADPTPALMAAVQGDEVEVVFNLLASVADGEAGLDHAAEQDESVARMLLEAGAEPTASGCSRRPRRLATRRPCSCFSSMALAAALPTRSPRRCKRVPPVRWWGRCCSTRGPCQRTPTSWCASPLKRATPSSCSGCSPTCPRWPWTPKTPTATPPCTTRPMAASSRRARSCWMRARGATCQTTRATHRSCSRGASATPSVPSCFGAKVAWTTQAATATAARPATSTMTRARVRARARAMASR